MMRAALCLILVLLAAPAFADSRSEQALTFCAADQTYRANCAQTSDARVVASTTRQSRSYDGTVVGGRPAGCPHRYCGCEVSIKVFGRIVSGLNLAVNWVRKFPRTAPAAGMVAARSGHVFYIESVIDERTVIAYDPNSGGGKTRIHERSLRGYTVVNPHATNVASQ